MRHAQLFKPLICAAFAIPIYADAQQSITLTAPTKAFRANSTAQATVTKRGPFLEVAILRHLVWTLPKHAEQTQLVSYSAALATNTEEGQWHTVRKSAEIETPLKLQPGGTKQMKAETLLIPIDGIKQLDKHWILIQLTLRNQNSPSGYG